MKVSGAVIAAIVIRLCAGCEAPLRIQPGMSAVRINVRAEPKAGYVPQTNAAANNDPYASGYGLTPAAEGETGPFARVDYEHLDDIVVWLEPLDGAPPQPLPPVATIELNAVFARMPSIGVTSVGGRLLIRNRGVQPEVVYSMSEPNVFDLGAIPVGGERSHVVPVPGLIEILSESRINPIAQVYVAPTAWVRRAGQGDSIIFADVPPGRYRIVSWHPRLPGSQSEIVLAPDQLGRATATVGVNSLPKIP